MNYHPFRIIVRHQLLANDYDRRCRYSRWCIQKFRDENFASKIVIGDEAAFCMNGTVNTWNVRQYAPKGEHPENFVFEKSAMRDKVTVWAALCGNGNVIGPFFFEENVNGQSYLDMINTYVVHELSILFNYNNIDETRFGEEIWWFQDGAPCHRFLVVDERLTELFGEQVIALNRNREWPPRSPDLTPCDFFLWGYVKNRVYRTPPIDTNDLRRRIIQEFDRLKNDQNLIIRAVRAMSRRAHRCIENGGGHV